MLNLNLLIILLHGRYYSCNFAALLNKIWI